MVCPGIPLCLEDVLLGAPGGSAIEVVSVVCEKVVEPCLIDVSAPEASELSATCKAEESQAAISAISQGGFENENNYDESIGQLCHDGCFNPLYEVALQQCDNVGIKVSVNTVRPDMAGTSCNSSAHVPAYPLRVSSERSVLTPF
eukprot:scaffold2691_cov417-Prasinococcus_capsulatus_cf.AAC.16